jgi:hypothetical protein
VMLTESSFKVLFTSRHYCDTIVAVIGIGIKCNAVKKF